MNDTAPVASVRVYDLLEELSIAFLVVGAHVRTCLTFKIKRLADNARLISIRSISRRALSCQASVKSCEWVNTW